MAQFKPNRTKQRENGDGVTNFLHYFHEIDENLPGSKNRMSCVYYQEEQEDRHKKESDNCTYFGGIFRLHKFG